MRVWILENVPDYEQGTRHGVYTSPVAAWDDLFSLVERNVFDATRGEFKLYVGADQSAPDQSDPKRDILVMIRYNVGDEIHLSGAHVKGSDGDTPTLSDWRDLQQVAGLLRQHATQQAGFHCSDRWPNHLATGSWTFRRDEDLR